MSIKTHDRCSKVIRSLRFNWIQNPETVLDERLQILGLRSAYLKNDPELFEVFRKKLYRKLSKKYRGLLAFIVPVHFIWQTKIMWQMLKDKSVKGQIYERIKNVITTSQFRKRSSLEKVTAQRVVDARSKQLEDDDLVCKLFRDLTLLE